MAARDGSFVVLLGGDCSIMFGALLGLRLASGELAGVVYIDAHADFGTLDESSSGSACSMNLALAVGRAAGPLAALVGEQPLVRGERVVHVGRRDEGEPEYGAGSWAEFGILDLPQSIIDAQGPRLSPVRRWSESRPDPVASGSISTWTRSTGS